MPIDLAHSRRALHRSRARLLVLLELEAQGVSSIGQLERTTGLRHDKIRAALHGAMPDYRVEDSLVSLGLARRLRAPFGPAYAITRAGQRIALIVARDRAAMQAARLARRAHAF